MSACSMSMASTSSGLSVMARSITDPGPGWPHGLGRVIVPGISTELRMVRFAASIAVAKTVAAVVGVVGLAMGQFSQSGWRRLKSPVRRTGRLVADFALRKAAHIALAA